MTIQESINERWREIKAENARLRELLRRVRPVVEKAAHCPHCGSTGRLEVRSRLGDGKEMIDCYHCADRRAALREIDEALRDA